MDELTLVIDGNRFTGWETILITRSMEQGPHEFELQLTNAWRLSSHRHIREGFEATLYCGNDLVITGFIDDVNPDYDAQKQTLVVRGRSKLGDLVDCSTLAKQFKNQTLDAIAREICKPFGIDVVVDTDVGKPFESVTKDDGQAPWEFLDYLARIRAVRLMGDERGRLVLTRAGNELAKTELVLGKNIERANGNFSSRERFGEYLVVAKNGASYDSHNDTVHVQAKAADLHVRRYRPIAIVADDDCTRGDCQSQADWQRNTHFGRGNQIVYTVRGWRDAGANLWTPNTRVPISDGYMGINEERLIVEVRLHLDEGGQYTELQVMPREAMELIALPEPKEADA